MNINKVLEGTKLELEITGRLDTITAPELDAEIKQNIDFVSVICYNIRWRCKEMKKVIKYVIVFVIFYSFLPCASLALRSRSFKPKRMLRIDLPPP